MAVISQSHPLLPRGFAVPPCGLAYFLRCVPRLWYASKTRSGNPNSDISVNNCNKIKYSKKQRNSTRLASVRSFRPAAPKRCVTKMPFKRRLVSPGNNPMKVEILSNGNAILLPQSRSFYNSRLDVLRKLCNIPNCRFNRMPQAVINKLGYNVERINEIIDQTLISKVGGTLDTVSEPDETIHGMTRFGDGYMYKLYNHNGVVEILVCFNNYVRKVYMCKLVLELKYDKEGRPIDTLVSLIKAYGSTPGQHYCKPFLLSTRLDTKQFFVKVLLASVLDKIPDQSDFYGVYLGPLFRQRATVARSTIFAACQQYATYMNSKVGLTTPKPQVNPVIQRKPAPSRGSVLHFRTRSGFEYFVVKFNDGKEYKINNSRFAIKEMYNLTLHKGCYFIHPMCFTPNWERFGSCSNRYCWIPAFALGNKRMPRELVPWPELNYGYLLQCGLEKILNGRLRKVKDDYFHFDVNYKEKRPAVRFGSKIGVKLDNDFDGIIKNIEILYDDISAGVITGCSLRSDNPLLNTIATRMSNEINKQCEKKKDLIIPTCLSGRQKRELSELFPEINFDFTESTYSTHALATAMRHAENYLLARKNGFKEFIDAGGDVTYYLGKMVDNVHVCTPCVDVKDAHRHISRSNKLDKMIGMCENISMCENLTQDCCVEKPNIIAVQVYDMTLENFAKALLSHKAKRVDFSMIIPPEIYDEDCDVSLFDDSVTVKCENEFVKYTYGDSGETYQHDRESLKQILATQIFEVDGVVFKKTLESSRKQLHFYSIVPCPNMTNGTYIAETYYRRSESDKLCVRVPVENHLKTLEYMKIKMDKSCFHNLVEYAMNTVLRLDEKAFEYILSQYRARKSISIRGGKVTQNGADMHPQAVAGLIGSIAGYGLRLRELSHKAAKIAYTQYYAPSLLGMICKIIAYVMRKMYNWTYEYMMEVIKFFTPNSILSELTSDQCGVYEYIGEYRFKQSVTIIGNKSNRKILTESFEKFKKFSEKTYENLDAHTADKGDLFTPDIQKTLNDIFDLGGAGTNNLSNNVGFSMSPFSTYNKLFCLLRLWLGDESRVIRYTNYICGVWDYFRSFSLSTVDFIKSVLKDLLLAIKNGVVNFSKSVADNLRRAASTMKSIIKTRNSNWESELEKMLMKTDEMFKPTVSKSMESESSEDSNGQTYDLDKLFDLGNEGGSGRSTGLFVNTCRCIRRKTSQVIYDLRSLSSILTKYLFKVTNFIRDLSLSFYNFVKTIIEKSLETENLVNIIEGFAFTATNLFVAALIGDISLLRLFIASCSSLYLRLTNTNKKWFGNNMAGDAVCSMIVHPGYMGLLTAPIKLMTSKVFASKVKTGCSSIIKDEEKALSLVASEVNNKYNFLWFNPAVFRSLVGISTIILLVDPRFGLCLIIFLVLLNDYVNYLKSICVNANISLSYGSILKRTSPTARYSKLKKIFAEKFDKNLFTAKNENDNEEERGSEGGKDTYLVGLKPKDSDVEVELDYSGKEVDKTGKRVNWGSEVSSVNSENNVDGLNFSLLTPTLDRTAINCSVDFPLSHALLSFPMTNTHDFVSVNEELYDCVLEYYSLEAKKLHDEMGKVNYAVRKYFEHTCQNKSVRDTVWTLRNYLNDTSLFICVNSRDWFRLAKGDKGSCSVQPICKYTIDNDLINFKQEYSGVTFCSDEMVGMFSNKRCLSLESIIRLNRTKINQMRTKDIVFYNKPPGAGKTTSIVNSMVDDIKNKIVSIALTHTSSGKKEIIHKLQQKGVSSAQKMVYTYDSILMNNTETTVDRVYCDEIFMVHAGEWLAVMSLINTNVIRCYGDRNQIPFINRVAHMVCTHHKDVYLTFKTIDDNISYRCPVDVCYLLSTLTDAAGNLLYPNGVYPMGDNRNILRSMDVEPISGLQDTTVDALGKHISFTRPEREEIDAYIQHSGVTGASVQTVHEVQGGTFPRVYLHRLRKYDNPLYDNINQFVVSISRHTERMKYRVISDKMYDRIGEKISAISNVQDYVIKEYMFKQRVSTYYLRIDHPKSSSCFSRPSASHFQAINDFMSLVNPNLSAYEYIHRTLIFEYHDFELPYLEDVDIKMNKGKVYNPGEFIIANLLGKGERARPNTWKQALISLSKRNFSAPRVNDKLDVLATAERLCQGLFKCFNFSKLMECYDPVVPDMNRIGEWLDSRDGAKFGKLKRNFNHTLLLDQFQPLKFMIKSDMKPKMDMSSYSSYDPPANIIYYQNVVNLFYSPLFLEIFDRITYCLSHKVIMYSGMNLETLSDLIAASLPMPINCYQTTEIDFRMFDKSQGVLFKVYEEMVYKTFKFSEEVYDNFKFTEYFTRYTGDNGVSGELGAQRRTGSPNTWLSNTLVTLGILMTQYDLDDIELILVSGDDSLIFSKRQLPNVTAEINRDFGFEAKFIMNSVPYFCSKFIYLDGGRVKVTPDAQRMFEKLSSPIRRRDFEEGTIIKERYTSYKDLMRDYMKDTTCLHIDSMLSIRHNIPPMSSYAALCYIHCMFANMVAFRKLWDERFSVNI
ncbi:ORF1a/1b fusion polyprotein [Pueraria lobata-associated crinivirus]|nr:ORF1a/1b fusion polyprotein [Pueraria lobata-associated crinivirus]